MNRGSILDPIYIMVLILVFSIAALLCWVIWNEVTENPTLSAKLEAAGVKDKILPVTTTLRGLDTMAVTLFILLNVGAIMSALMVRTHPIFFILSLMMLGMFILIAAIMGNVYYAVASHSFIAPYANDFPLIYSLFTWLPIFSLILNVLLAIATYGKATGGGPQYSY